MSKKSRRLPPEDLLRIRSALHLAFPKAFMAKGQDKVPLAVGIYHDIRKAMPEMRAFQLSRALHDYTTGALYLRAMKAGAVRVDLDGAPRGSVSDQHAAEAQERLKRINKRKARLRRRKPQKRAA